MYEMWVRWFKQQSWWWTNVFEYLLGSQLLIIYYCYLIWSYSHLLQGLAILVWALYLLYLTEISQAASPFSPPHPGWESFTWWLRNTEKKKQDVCDSLDAEDSGIERDLWGSSSNSKTHLSLKSRTNISGKKSLGFLMKSSRAQEIPRGGTFGNASRISGPSTEQIPFPLQMLADSNFNP